MYTQNNNEAAIRRIQEYLYEIHLYEKKDNLTARNGIYTEATERAVMEFQKEENLPITGIVDLSTFEKLRSKAMEYGTKNKADSHLYTPKGYPLNLGSKGADVDVLHALLRSLAEYDPNFPTVPRTAYFSQETKNAVLYMQRTFLMEENGNVDATFFARLENELDARIAFLEKL